jgi:hypothetical protein
MGLLIRVELIYFLPSSVRMPQTIKKIPTIQTIKLGQNIHRAPATMAKIPSAVLLK